MFISLWLCVHLPLFFLSPCSFTHSVCSLCFYVFLSLALLPFFSTTLPPYYYVRLFGFLFFKWEWPFLSLSVSVSLSFFFATLFLLQFRSLFPSSSSSLAFSVSKSLSLSPFLFQTLPLILSFPFVSVYLCFLLPVPHCYLCSPFLSFSGSLSCLPVCLLFLVSASVSVYPSLLICLHCSIFVCWSLSLYLSVFPSVSIFFHLSVSVFFSWSVLPYLPILPLSNSVHSYFYLSLAI